VAQASKAYIRREHLLVCWPRIEGRKMMSTVATSRYKKVGEGRGTTWLVFLCVLVITGYTRGQSGFLLFVRSGSSLSFVPALACVFCGCSFCSSHVLFHRCFWRKRKGLRDTFQGNLFLFRTSSWVCRVYFWRNI
jgi:hypothetical protein